MTTTILADDISSKEVNDLLKTSPITIIVALAAFVPKCKALLEQLQTNDFEVSTKSAAASSVVTSQSCCGDGGGGCCDPNDNVAANVSNGTMKPQLLIVQVDKSDELEEIAVDYGLTAIPSYQIRHYDTIISNSCSEGQSDDNVTVNKIQKSLLKSITNIDFSSNNSNDAPPPNTTMSCCSTDQSSPWDASKADASDLLRLVKESYATTVNSSKFDDKKRKNAVEGCCVSMDPALNGYNLEELVRSGADKANLGLGCGNPLSFSNLTEGETVVDLGSGAGIDCFLASNKVGPTGKVIGIDMTPDMIYKARQNAKSRLSSSQTTEEKRHDNVTFRLGEIEHLPVADHIVDCVISNCVVNLSPDKPQVLKDIHRILKANGQGRIAISDVVLRPRDDNLELPEHLKTAEALAC